MEALKQGIGKGRYFVDTGNILKSEYCLCYDRIINYLIVGGDSYAGRINDRNKVRCR